MNSSGRPLSNGGSSDSPVIPAQEERSVLGSRVRRTPVIYGLIAATALVFLGQLIGQYTLGFDLVGSLGAKDNMAIAAGELWRLITPVFIHGGPVHFFVNMYSLYAIGPVVERFFGTGRTLTLYLLSGIAGVVLSLSFSPYRSVGASGAIFGLLGSLGAFLYANRTTFGQAGRMQLRHIILVALLNLGLGLSPGIDNWGHFGGLLFGAILAWFISPSLEVVRDELTERVYLTDRRPWRVTWPAILIGSVVLALLAITAILSQ
ncbi:MAG: rhomboid family intramembrane serine protease [Anaerolineaceae bacterium]|nr:MAG: rhomboid family intramembrane serine protease [Anaerolineaceae bacterium]